MFINDYYVSSPEINPGDIAENKIRVLALVENNNV